MAYKKFNIYEGVNVSEKILSFVIVLGIVALAVIIIAFAKPNEEEKIFDSEVRLLSENEHPHHPVKQKNTLELIK